MYGKIFEQIYDGSLRMNWKAMITFQQMIVLCDDVGVVDMTPDAIHFRTGIPLEIIKDGILDLEKPDPQSRTPDKEGRRIERLDDHRDWGWRIVNHKYYRDLISKKDRQEYMKEYMRDRRKQSVNSCKQKLADLTHTDTDTDTNKRIVVGTFLLSDNSEYEIEQSFIDKIKNAYPDINVKKEIKLITAWCIANPKKRKTRQGATRFINNWFSTAQKTAEEKKKFDNDPKYECVN